MRSLKVRGEEHPVIDSIIVNGGFTRAEFSQGQLDGRQHETIVGVLVAALQHVIDVGDVGGDK